MVAKSTNKNRGRTVVHSPIPVVDVASRSTILGFVATSTATPEPPPTILVIIAMIAAHSCHHIVGRTPEVEGVVPAILVSCPIAREWRGYNIFTRKVPTAILIIIAVITLNTVKSLLVVVALYK